MPEAAAAAPTRSTAVPCVRYRDATAAIDWLCRVIGFERHLVVPDDAGGIAHAQLVLGGGMVMLGTARDDEFGRHMAQPGEIGGRQTQVTYVVVADADAVLARALAERAAVTRAIRDEEFGGRGFVCRDPEGHLWSVGTYDPWA